LAGPVGGRGILAGLRIVELSAFVAVPLAGATLAAMGADVIRVDPVGGGIDIHRWPVLKGVSLYWSALNQGKRSVTIDTRSPRGQELVRLLVASGGPDGGFLITNLGGRGWASYASLKEARPDLVMVLLNGNRDGSPAVDYTVNARVGFPLVTGADPTGAPVNQVLPAWDGMAGHLVAMALLAAERHRSRTGEGQLVTISLADVALAFASRLGIVAEAKLVPEPRGRYGNYVYGTFGKDFPTLDGHHVIVVALTPHQWKSLQEATGLAAEFGRLQSRLGVDLDNEAARWGSREEIAAILAGWTAAHDLADVRARFDRAGVLWSPYQTFKQLVSDDPECSPANPMFTNISQPGLGAYPMAGSQIDFGAFNRRPAETPPRLGQHTREVIAEVLGMTPADIAQLGIEGVISV
jgi:2-methylfumaryl-CoA isomerase